MTTTFIGGVWGAGVDRVFLGPRSCLVCRQTIYEGHTDCVCDKSHDSRCNPGA